MTKGKEVERDGFQIRRTTVENGIPCLTSLDTANALTNVIESMTFASNVKRLDCIGEAVINHLLKEVYITASLF